MKENTRVLMSGSVAVIKTSPKKVIKDYQRLMKLGEYAKCLNRSLETILKLNLSWSLFYPASSTPPWQLEGVINTLKKDRYKKITAVENRTVVTNPMKGAERNKWLPLLNRYDVPFVALNETKWIKFKPKAEMLVLDKIFESIEIPQIFLKTNIIHLATQKTHGHSIMTGAMKNAFGGLLKEARHHCHKHIHDVLVDLLVIQKEIHKGIFATVDGCVAGDGAGPRTMEPKIKNYILASSDMVAIDAVSAKMMGFDPMKIDFIKKAHDLGLGCGDINQIEIVGDNIQKVNYGFNTRKSPVIFFDQVLRKSFLEPIMFKTWFFNLCILGSAVYHDYIWYPLVGQKKVKNFLKTKWGKLFQEY